MTRQLVLSDDRTYPGAVIEDTATDDGRRRICVKWFKWGWTGETFTEYKFGAAADNVTPYDGRFGQPPAEVLK